MTTNAKLDAKVKAVNSAHQYANELYPRLAEIFTPLVGNRIFKQDLSLLKSVEKLLPALPNTHELRVVRHTSPYSLFWVVTANREFTSEWGNNYVFHETHVYIGSIQDCVLKEITKPVERKVDYCEKHIELLRGAYNDANAIAKNLLRKLDPFGEYDR